MELWQLDLIPIKVGFEDVVFYLAIAARLIPIPVLFREMEEPAGGHQAGKIPTQQCFGLRDKNSALNNI
jgi:hypothetical protein